MMLTKILAFSSNISIPTDSITASDIKYANLIFVEHKKLLNENILLYDQINNLKRLNLESERIDSIKTKKLNEYNSLNQEYLKRIDRLNSEINKKNKVIKGWQIGSLTVSVGLILFLLYK